MTHSAQTTIPLYQQGQRNWAVARWNGELYRMNDSFCTILFIQRKMVYPYSAFSEPYYKRETWSFSFLIMFPGILISEPILWC